MDVLVGSEAEVDQGTARQAQLFVACLPSAGLIYAEASWSQSSQDWLGAHVRLFTSWAGFRQKPAPIIRRLG